MNIEAWYQTDVGLKREGNQDSYLVEPQLGLYIVADGMGGHRGGEVASEMAVKVVKEYVAEVKTTTPRLEPQKILSEAYHKASRAIFDRSSQDANLRGMATTMVTALHRENKVYIGNVGDSRAYLLSPPGLWQITEDHSLFNEQLKAGLIRNITREQFEGKNIITKSVGFEADVNCDVTEVQLSKGQIIVLCSDGLSGLITDQCLAEICLTLRPESAVPRLIAEAKKNGGDDNVTVVLLRVT